LVGVHCRLQLQRLGLLHQRADPVSLPARLAGRADAVQHLVAAGVGHQLGDHGRASRRQFVDYRDVEVGVVAHRQRARDRRGAHHQLVRTDLAPAAAALHPQGKALVHAEAVLLVDDGKPELVEVHLVLEQRVGADGERGGARGNRLQRLFPFLFLLAARQPGHLDLQRPQPRAELAVVLLGEDLGGRHDRGLVAALDRLQRGERGHDGLAAADVALQQPLHRVRAREVGADLGEHAGLGARELERQRGEQGLRQDRVLQQRVRPRAVALLVVQAHRDLLREQFVELDALPGRVRVLDQALRVGIRRRVVQDAHRLAEGGQAELAAHRLRQGVVEVRALQRPGRELAQRVLPQPRRGRVDRRQGLRQRRLAAQHLEARMDHLRAEEALPDLPHDAYARIGGQRPALALVKVEEAHRQAPAAVVDFADELAPGAKPDLGLHHGALDLDGVARQRLVDRRDAGLVLVAQRQVQDQVGQAREAQLSEALRHRGRDEIE
jgi:hypothetical protein